MGTKKIKKILIDRGLTISKLAKMAGYHRVYLSYVINGHFESKKARAAIAGALGIDPVKIWRAKHEF